MNNIDPSTDPGHEREHALFTLAAAKQGAERAAFLDRECAGDDALRQRLESLLAAHDRTDSVLDAPVTAFTSTEHEAPNTSETEGIGQTVGRYKLLEKIGEGGWGVVYVAEQTEPVRRRVALKVIKINWPSSEK